MDWTKAASRSPWHPAIYMHISVCINGQGGRKRWSPRMLIIIIVSHYRLNEIESIINFVGCSCCSCLITRADFVSWADLGTKICSILQAYTTVYLIFFLMLLLSLYSYSIFHCLVPLGIHCQYSESRIATTLTFSLPSHRKLLLLQT